MPTARRTSSKPAAEIGKTTARRFPLVHKLIHFADLRNFYREMRKALISANRRSGAQQGLVTKAKNKIALLEAEMNLLEQERDDLLSYRQRVEEEANQISAVLPRLKGRLLQVQQIEQAHGGPTSQSIQDFKLVVERLIERAAAVEFFEESIDDDQA